jgi:hypothetical protein
MQGGDIFYLARWGKCKAGVCVSGLLLLCSCQVMYYSGVILRSAGFVSGTAIWCASMSLISCTRFLLLSPSPRRRSPRRSRQSPPPPPAPTPLPVMLPLSVAALLLPATHPPTLSFPSHALRLLCVHLCRLVALVAFVNFAFTVVGIVLVDKWGRRRLTLASLGGVVVALVGLGVVFFFQHRDSAVVVHSGPHAACWYSSCIDCVVDSKCGFFGDSARGLCVPGNSSGPARPVPIGTPGKFYYE